MEYKLICKHCGKEFTHKTFHKAYCDECNAERKRERNRKFMQKKRGTVDVVAKPRENKALSQVIRELEEYNKTHGTRMSYGQYVSIIG